MPETSTSNAPSPAKLWNRNFVLLWQGQVVSSIGKQLFALAAMLWLKDLTQSGTLMGLVMTVALLPMVVLGPVAGVIVDRWNRQRLIAWTDLAGGVLVLFAAVMFFLPSATALRVGIVFTVTVLTGLLDTFSQPAIGSSLPILVPQARLEAANSLNMSGVQVAIFCAQAIAGVLFVTTGMPLLVVLNAATYLAAGVAELFIRIPPHAPRTDGSVHPWQRFRNDLMEGLRFVYHHRGMRTALALSAAMNFFIAPVIVLLPFFVEDYVGAAPQWYGYLMAAFGAGTVLGYVAAGAAPTRGRARQAVMAIAMIGQSALIPPMLLIHSPGALIPGFVLAGALGGVVNVNFITLLQLATPGSLMGRVQGVAVTVSGGFLPLGMALSGVVFDLVGKNVPLMYLVGSIPTLLFSMLALASRHYRAFLSYVPPDEPAREASTSL